MPEIMDESVSRRKYLRYIGAGIAAALGAGIGYYYFEYKRQPVILPTSTTSTTSIATSTITQASTLNPVVQYALERGIDVDVADRLKVLYELNENNKALVDYLCSVKNFYGDVRSLQLKILDGSNGFPSILKDGNVSDEEASALRYLSGFDHETQKSYIEFGLSGDVSKYLAINSLLTDQIFAKWAVERKFLIQNHKLTDLKINCLKEPEKYGTEVLKSFIDDIKSSETFSDVGDELEKLPEVGEALDKNDMSTNESIEDIVYSILLAKNPGLVRKNLDIMLNEGIPYKRKYCTPLQALEWHYVDNEPDKDNPLEKSDFNLRYFIENVWESSRVSNYYHSERWKNFDEVVDRLNSIDLVSIYMKSNIRYKSDIELYGMENYNASALETFMNKGGDCEDHAMFALYSLIKNGYYYDNFESYNTNAACILDVQWGKIGKPVALGHAVCLYKLDNLFYYLDNCGYKNGPFHTIEDTVNEINPSWKLYQFINENWRITKKVTR